MHRKFSVAVLTGVSLILSGCASELPKPVEPGAVKAIPNLSQARFDIILDRIQKSIAQADQKADSKLLSKDFADPALQMRSSEYGLAKATSKLNPPFKPVALQLGTHTVTVSKTFEFPRVAMQVTKTSGNDVLPMLVAYVQDNARSNYKLWSYHTLFPGVKVPSIKTLAAGTDFPKNPKDFMVDPQEVATLYAKTLHNEKDENRSKFSDDPYRSTLLNLVKSLGDGVKSVGKIQASTKPIKDTKSYALLTNDGGALVVAYLDTDLQFNLTSKGAKITLGGQIGALIEQKTKSADVKAKVNVKYLSSLVFYVPPAGNKDKKVEVLGANAVLADAVRDDSNPPA